MMTIYWKSLFLGLLIGLCITIIILVGRINKMKKYPKESAESINKPGLVYVRYGKRGVD